MHHGGGYEGSAIAPQLVHMDEAAEPTGRAEPYGGPDGLYCRSNGAVVN